MINNREFDNILTNQPHRINELEDAFLEAKRSISSLQSLCGCDFSETYPGYKFGNDYILKRPTYVVMVQINKSKADINSEYNRIRDLAMDKGKVDTDMYIQPSSNDYFVRVFCIENSLEENERLACKLKDYFSNAEMPKVEICVNYLEYRINYDKKIELKSLLSKNYDDDL